MIRRQARSSGRLTGRRELHDLGSRASCAALPPSWQIATNRTPRDYAEALGHAPLTIRPRHPSYLSDMFLLIKRITDRSLKPDTT